MTGPFCLDFEVFYCAATHCFVNRMDGNQSFAAGANDMVTYPETGRSEFHPKCSERSDGGPVRARNKAFICYRRGCSSGWVSVLDTVSKRSCVQPEIFWIAKVGEFEAGWFGRDINAG